MKAECVSPQRWRLQDASRRTFPAREDQPQLDSQTQCWCKPGECGEHLLPKFCPPVPHLHAPVCQLHVESRPLSNMYVYISYKKYVPGLSGNITNSCVSLDVSKLMLSSVRVEGKKLGFCMMCTMEAHIQEVFVNSGDTVKPSQILTGLKCKYNYKSCWSIWWLCWSISCMFCFLSHSDCKSL